MTQRQANPPLFLHQTDLFRPHNDPDDHWDLACAFALCVQGMAALSGILIDYPPGAPILSHKSDPDVGAVAQLSYLTGIHPQVAVGRRELFSTRRSFVGRPASGVKMVLNQLRNSREKIYIVIVGAARDIAEALVRDPALFEEKCRGIYLNIGSGSPDPKRVKSMEWNTKLDPAAFAQIFQAPCPIFWMPCLEDEEGAGDLHSREFATHYQFRPKDILDELPREMRNYFGWMYAKDPSSTWLENMHGDFDAVLDQKGSEYRMMYSTGSFFDLAGYGVTRGGDLLPKSAQADWVYQFESIHVRCSREGITEWTPASSPSNRLLFRVLDPERYPAAMISAMRQLLLAAFAQDAPIGDVPTPVPSNFSNNGSRPLPIGA